MLTPKQLMIMDLDTLKIKIYTIGDELGKH